jgi:1-pyrroline-5-carboxylate dehydrogenase
MDINGIPKFPKPENSPFEGYKKDTEAEKRLRAEIVKLRNTYRYGARAVLPLYIGGKEVYATTLKQALVPHRKGAVLAEYCCATEDQVKEAIEGVLAARAMWAGIPWQEKLFIFWTAADLLEKKYRETMVAAVMEEFSKSPFEAFIDVQELIDFLRFNVYWAQEIYAEQPDSTFEDFNMLDHRPLEGFVFALPPNNFIAIGGNLPTAPLIMGNVVVAKPSSDVTYCFHQFLSILWEAGLPKEVLAVLHGDSRMIGKTIMSHKDLSGIHFTGGTDTFNSLFKTTAENVDGYTDYVRIIGETGGKDFIVVLNDADLADTATAIIVGGFGYQGRKCSATSRVYICEKEWALLRPLLIGWMNKIKVGDVLDFSNYMNAIINEREYRKLVRYIEQARTDASRNWVKELVGGGYSEENGWFIHPTLIVTDDPNYKTMEEELFGPIVTICVLPDEMTDDELFALCNQTSPYALTGAVHTTSIKRLSNGLNKLRHAAGNIYRWKTTGARVGKQPFGGARKSGTAGKVGFITNLRNWVSPRTISLMTSPPKNPFPPYLDGRK